MYVWPVEEKGVVASPKELKLRIVLPSRWRSLRMAARFSPLPARAFGDPGSVVALTVKSEYASENERTITHPRSTCKSIKCSGGEAHPRSGNAKEIDSILYCKVHGKRSVKLTNY